MSNILWYSALLILTTVQLFPGISGQYGLLRSIFIRHYGSSVHDYVDVYVEDASTLSEKLDKNKTVVYIHGFDESVDSKSVITVEDAYIQRGDHNVLAVDYRNISKMGYTEAVYYVPEVGAVIASALGKIIKDPKKWEKLRIVGHSLGAQIAAQVGSASVVQIPRITGLDPAGPLFNFIDPYLTYKDAAFVDIIHTDYGFYGIARTSGSVDFFPNNGRRIQPGCPLLYIPLSNEDFCSHHRSWEFYAESVRNENAFIAVKCSSFFQFFIGACKNNEQIPMGYATPTNVNGTYYLTTGSKSPFGLGENGTKI